MAISVTPDVVNIRVQTIIGSVRNTARVGFVTVKITAPTSIEISYPSPQSP
jgi:hypothetical protein